MTTQDQLILSLIKEALSRTELTKEQQKQYFEDLTKEFEPASLRILITSCLSVHLEELLKVAEKSSVKEKIMAK